MTWLIFEDITVELLAKGDCFLTEVAHLILETTVNDQVIDKVNLVSRESEPGIWDATQHLTLREISTEFTISVSLELYGNEHLPLGSIELSGPVLYDVLGKRSEIPLMAHESYPELVLKAKIRLMAMEDLQRLFSSFSQRGRVPAETSLVESLNDDALAAMDEFDRYGNLEKLQQAISKLQVAVETASVDDPNRIAVISHLGIALQSRFESLGNLQDLNNSIIQHQLAASLVPEGHSDKPNILNNLGHSLLTRYRQTGEFTDLSNSISNLQTAVNLSHDHSPYKPSRLANLGNSFRARFDHMGNLVDINNAIEIHQQAVKLTHDHDPEKPSRLNNLGNSLMIRFHRLGNFTDIDDAIIQHQAAARLWPEGHPLKPDHLGNLGACFIGRVRRSRNLTDLELGISHTQTAVDLISDLHPSKPRHLHNLGLGLSNRFVFSENRSDIDDSIIRLQQAVTLTPDNHPHKTGYLRQLGDAFVKRFENFGDLTDLDSGIAQIQLAVDLSLDNFHEKPTCLATLGRCLMIRFERLGDIMDIDNSIAQLEAGIDLTPDNFPGKSLLLTNLGTALQIRFTRLGILADIDNAIKRQQAAADLFVNDNPEKAGNSSNLGNSLMSRFERLGNLADLELAIVSHKAAISLSPDSDPRKRSFHTCLGISLTKRFGHLKDPADLDAAIVQFRKAVSLTPEDHPKRSALLTDLGNCLNARQLVGDSSGVEEAISLQEMAVNLTPESHPDKSRQLKVLGVSLMLRFARGSRPEDAEAAITHLSASATSLTGPPMVRFEAAMKWKEFASLINHSTLLNSYECLLGLMPLVAWLGLSIEDRHRHLTKMGATAREAAAIAISLGQYVKAVEWLEQGRSIVWTQILQLRTPVDRLRDVDPKLTDRLLHVSRLLDQGIGPSEGKSQSQEEEGRMYRALTTEWETIIEEVQSLPGFQDFLKPPKISRLLNAAKNGPVVILNIADLQCDALALLPEFDDIIHIPLPKVSSQIIRRLRDELKDVLSSSGIRLRAERAAKRETDESDDEGCRQILAELWNRLVKPVLDYLALQPNLETLPHIWWCATGPLAFLPIHAAGIYKEESSYDQLSNFAISSYTPTLSALLDLPSTAPLSSFRLLSVIESSAPGASYIPNTQQELERIQDRLRDRDLAILEGPEAIKQTVMKAMEDCHWIHLACHGVQNPIEPTKSALLLHDGHLTLEEIIKLDLPHAEFAFLSACQTTTGDEKLSEEAVHIAGGMLLAGYRSVVATMWSIQDELAPEVADEFYAHITKDDKRPDNRKAAEALHVSVMKLRKKRDLPFTAWIPFVHLGI